MENEREEKSAKKLKKKLGTPKKHENKKNTGVVVAKDVEGNKAIIG